MFDQTTTLLHASDAMKLAEFMPEINEDGVQVQRFTIDKEAARLNNLRAALRRGRPIYPGNYVRLIVDNTLWMSDTPAEMSDHEVAFRKAQLLGGRVLINGLGLGMLVHAMLQLPQVEHIDVVEIDERICRLIGPLYESERCTIHHADALTITWPKNSHWSVVWHDIWPTISQSNLPDMKRLHRSYGRRCDWQGSWARKLL